MVADNAADHGCNVRGRMWVELFLSDCLFFVRPSQQVPEIRPHSHHHAHIVGHKRDCVNMNLYIILSESPTVHLIHVAVS